MWVAFHIIYTSVVILPFLSVSPLFLYLPHRGHYQTPGRVMIKGRLKKENTVYAETGKGVSASVTVQVQSKSKEKKRKKENPRL
jgi:hypothetical protein